MSQGDVYAKFDDTKGYAGKTDLGKLILGRMLQRKQDVASGKVVEKGKFFAKDKKAEKPKVVQESEKKYAKFKDAKVREERAKLVLARGSLTVPEDAKVVKIQNPGLDATLKKATTIYSKNPETSDGATATQVPKDAVVAVHDVPGSKNVCFLELFELDDKKKKKKKGEGYARRADVKTGQKFVPVDGPLFPDEPGLGDLKQGAIGDCYLIAGLGSIVEREPKVIKRAILDNGDGTVTVRLFDKSKDVPPKFSEKYVTFEKSVLKSDEGNHAKDTLWVQMLEKAYAIHSKEAAPEGDGPNTEDGPTTGSYTKMGEGGYSSDVFEAFLGRPSTKRPVKARANLGETLKGLRDQLTTPKKVEDGDVAKIAIALQEKGLPEDVAKKIAAEFKGKSGDDMMKNVEKEVLPELFKTIPGLGKILSDNEVPQDEIMIAVRKSATADPLLKIVTDFTDNVPNMATFTKEDLDDLLASDVFLALPTAMQKEFREATAGKFPGKQGTGIYSEAQEESYGRIVEALTVEGCVSMGTGEDVGKVAGKGFSGGEAVSETGIIGTHAYTITGTYEPKEGEALFLPGAKKQVKYVRVRNPWGDGEANKNVKKSDKHGMEYVVVTDPETGDFVSLIASPTHKGEFYMELNDITRYCTDLYVTEPVVSEEERLRTLVEDRTKDREMGHDEVEGLYYMAEGVLYDEGFEKADEFVTVQLT